MHVQVSSTMTMAYAHVGTTAHCNPTPIIVLRCPEAVTLTSPVHPMQLMSKLEPTR